jgi:hypothetical protein
MLMASCPQLQCVHLLLRGRARIASVDSCHQHASALNISLPGEAHPDLQTKPRGLSLSSGQFWSYRRGPLQRHIERGDLKGRLVRYCDDFVVVCPRPPEGEKRWLDQLMERLGLTLHPEKTRVVHVGNEWVNFLGYKVRRRQDGRGALDIADKAKTRIRDTLRDITRRTYMSLDNLISELNLYIRGAGEYFKRAEPRTLWNLDRFVLARIARWSRHKRGRRLPEWSLARGGPLYREHGLVTWWRPKKPA